jgi:CBS domain-containing protein
MRIKSYRQFKKLKELGIFEGSNIYRKPNTATSIIDDTKESIMRHYKEHLILSGTTIREALKVLDKLAKDAISFVVDEKDRLIGSLTDGDIRRGLIQGAELEQPVDDIIQSKPRFIRKGEQDIEKVINYRKNDFKIIPILDKNDVIVNVINFGELKSYLPIDVVSHGRRKRYAVKPLD